MKKIFTVLCIIMALLVCLSVPCFAAEAEDATEAPPAASDVVVAEEAEPHTVFTRLWEFVNQYKGEEKVRVSIHPFHVNSFQSIPHPKR